MGEDRADNMSRLVCRMLVVLAVICSAAFSSPTPDDWEESTEPTIIEAQFPEQKPIALLDERLSRSVSGAFRGSQEEIDAAAELSVQLDAVNSIVDLTHSDDDFLMSFTIFNPGKTAVKICKRDTPLEGSMSQLFVIQNKEGKVMEYRGVDAKRTEQPAESEYVTIAAGESRTRRVRISR